MNAKKIFVITILLLFSLLAASCGGNQDADVAVVVALTQTAMALEQQSALPTATNVSVQQAPAPSPTAETVQSSATNTPPPYYGTVTGTINFQADASLWVYAVDYASGLWVKIAVSRGGSETPYLLELAPGTYQIFAFPSGAGYSLDGKTLSAVTVISNQTVSAVNLVTPTQTTCGPSFGVPASPDGNFAAIAGASAGCLAGSQQNYTPMSADDCSILNAALSANTGIQGKLNYSAAFNDYVNSKSGAGCLLSFSATGVTLTNYTGLSNLVESTLQTQGWRQNQSYGASGAGSYAIAYTKDKFLCLMSVRSEPSDSSLCSGNEPFAVCWERLTPEQKTFSLTLNCAQANP